MLIISLRGFPCVTDCWCVLLQLSQQEGELQQCERERDQAVLRVKVLEKKLQDLEGEAETKANSKEDRARQIKLMEVNRDGVQSHGLSSYTG